MNETRTTNPYACTAQEPLGVPFAGRQGALARLRQHLTDPARAGGLLILGRRRIGKTAFLHAFDDAFDESFVGVFVPLREVLPAPENDFWLSIAQSITERLVMRAFTLHRLSELAPPADDARDWFATTFLPPVLTLIRPHRRLVFLADDADALLDAVQAGTLAPDTLHYLRWICDQQPRFQMALTLDAQHEARLGAFAPLVRSTDPVRLNNLAAAETGWLLTEPVRDLYVLADDAVTAAQRMTGGEPVLVQALGCALFRAYHGDTYQTRFTSEDIKRLGAEVFPKVEADLSRVYDSLNYNEQRVLRAISQLIYADPLRPVPVSRLTDWMADSDDPLDATAVSAALRSLEFCEVITLMPGGIRLTSDLMQRWLLEHAYDVPLAAPPNVPASADGKPALARRNRGLRLALLLVLILMFVVALLLLSALSTLPREVFLIPPDEPTVTLPQ
jgi:hypothetical protein